MKLLCRLFGHSYLSPETLACDPVFGRILMHECRRCGRRLVEDDEDRRKREQSND